MPFWNIWNRSDDEESQSYSQSTKIVCQQNQEGKMVCKKYTSSYSSDQPYQQTFQSNLPNEMDDFHDEMFKQMQSMFKGFFGGSLFGFLRGNQGSNFPFSHFGGFREPQFQRFEESEFSQRRFPQPFTHQRDPGFRNYQNTFEKKQGERSNIYDV